MILIDSSAWIDYLRDEKNETAARLWDMLSDEVDIATTGVIVAEILVGQKNASVRRSIQRDLGGMISLPAQDPEDYIAAAKIYRDCRAKGITVRGLTDYLIAAVAIRHNAVLFHKDKDFEQIKRAAPALQTLTA